MSDATTEQEEVSDDWAAALNEQNAATAGASDSVDDAFTAAQDARPAANPAVFQQFDSSGSRPGTRRTRWSRGSRSTTPVRLGSLAD